MIGYNELINSIFDSAYFEKPASRFSLLEKQNTSGKLHKVDFVLSGNAIVIKNDILSETSRGYKKIDNSVSFKRDCDGLLLIDKDDKHYLVFIELKSSFNEVANSAIYQIASSYVRLKHYLMAIDSYNAGNYEEIGIIISYPYTEKVGDNEVLSRREGLIKGGYGTFVDRCKMDFRNGKHILMNSSDIGIDVLSISSNLQLNKFKIININVPDGALTATVDLDKYLV